MEGSPRPNRLTWRSGRPLIIGELAAIAAFPLLLGYWHLPRTVVPFLAWGILSLWMQGRGRRDAGAFIPREWRLISIVGVALGVSSAGAFRVLTLLLAEYGFTLQAAYPQALPVDSVGLAVLVIMISLLAGVGEEFFYRGYLMRRLGDLFGSRLVGVASSLLVSALVFALAHDWPEPGSALGMLALGLVDGVLYLFSGRNLLMPVLFHASWDTVLIVLAWAKF